MIRSIFLKRAVSIALVSVSLIQVGCTDSDGDESDDCQPIWTMDRSQITSNYSIRNSYLELEVQNAEPGIAIEVAQDGLVGDFSISANFDAFSAGTGSGGFAQMIVLDPLQPENGMCGASIGSGMIDAFVDFPSIQSDSRFTNGSSGSFMLSRIGGEVTATCTVGSKTASRTSVFVADDLTVAFQIGSNDSLLSGTTAIRIHEFLVSDSTAISGDDFNCDRVSF
jgi:hypothetical protein